MIVIKSKREKVAMEMCHLFSVILPNKPIKTQIKKEKVIGFFLF